MKDRTLIFLGLIFLILTVGAGVSRSLDEGNRMLGHEMAPPIKEIYYRQLGAARTNAAVLAGYSRDRAAVLRDWGAVLAGHGRERAEVLSDWAVLLTEYGRAWGQAAAERLNRAYTEAGEALSPKKID